VSLDQCLQDMCKKDSLLNYSTMVELSGLSALESRRFKEAWASVPTEQKLRIILRLVEMAENNPELHFTAVFEVSLRDENPEVRMNAISGLWEEEHRSIIPSLIDILVNDPSLQVRAKAATALGTFASLAQDGKLVLRDCELIMSSLMDALEDQEESDEIRRCALESVAPFDSLRIREYMKWAYDSADIEWKCSSLLAMGRTGQPEWAAYVIKEIDNPESVVRYWAANACGALGEGESVALLVPLLEDEDVEVRLEAVNALGNIGGPLAKRALNICMQSGDLALEDASREALEIIVSMEDPLAFESGL